jgi:hypothetical protein
MCADLGAATSASANRVVVHRSPKIRDRIGAIGVAVVENAARPVVDPGASRPTRGW